MDRFSRAVSLLALCGPLLAGCGDTQSDAGGNGEGPGGDIPCYDGQYCPDGCTCDTNSGQGVCREGADACVFGSLPSGEPPAWENLDGDWSEAYFCIDREGCELADDFAIELSQAGATVEASFDDGTSLSGTLSGQNLEWNADGGDYLEVGVWTFVDETTCIKSSRWEAKDGSNGGDCWGVATKSPDTPAPLPLPPECY